MLSFGELKIGEEIIRYKNIPCRINGIAIKEYPTPHVNIQVQVTEKCNADCAFCTFHNNKSEKSFDVDKFIRGLEAISKHVYISKITFTGGETSLEINAIKECVKYILKNMSNVQIKINTNGLKLYDLCDIQGIWQISLSRHSIDDEENFEIFNTTQIPTNKDILNICNSLKFKVEIDKFHLSCTMIKGYIDNLANMLKYIDYYAEFGIRDMGFVGLMGVNEYAKSHCVDFLDFNIEENDTLLLGRHCQYIKNDGICHCECQVYHVLAANGSVVEAYNRFARDHSNCNESNLVYNIDKWQQGFNGKELAF